MRCIRSRTKCGRSHGYMHALIACMNDGGRKAKRCRYCGFCKGCELRHKRDDNTTRARRIVAGHMGAMAVIESRAAVPVPVDELRFARCEADRDAAYYLSARFTKCEWCEELLVAQGRATCRWCDNKIAGRVPEAHPRDNDFSDVRRVLLEIAR